VPDGQHANSKAATLKCPLDLGLGQGTTAATQQVTALVSRHASAVSIDQSFEDVRKRSRQPDREVAIDNDATTRLEPGLDCLIGNAEIQERMGDGQERNDATIFSQHLAGPCDELIGPYPEPARAVSDRLEWAGQPQQQPRHFRCVVVRSRRVETVDAHFDHGRILSRDRPESAPHVLHQPPKRRRGGGELISQLGGGPIPPLSHPRGGDIELGGHLRQACTAPGHQFRPGKDQSVLVVCDTRHELDECRC
jgi:hypothetical protein